MTLKELMSLQKQFDQAHAGRASFYVQITDDNIQELEHLIVCLVGELGEISNIVKKIKRGDKKANGSTVALSLSDPKVKADVSEEIADVFTYLMKICNQLGVDLEQEYLNKLKYNEKRFRGFRR